MRLSIIALLALGASPQAPQQTLVADVALSEFTPSLRLTLTLATGDYDVAIPSWRPEGYPSPQPRHATLGGERLRTVRAAYAAAIAAGLGKRGCDGAPVPAQEVILMNAPVPIMRIETRTRRLDAPDTWSCFTREALTLQKLVNDL